jgi:hypothetical protein
MTALLYGPWPVEVEGDISSFFGWRINRVDERLHVLPWADDEDTLNFHFPDLGARRILLSTTTVIPGMNGWAAEILDGRGYELTQLTAGDGAVMGVYVRRQVHEPAGGQASDGRRPRGVPR